VTSLITRARAAAALAERAAAFLNKLLGGGFDWLTSRATAMKPDKTVPVSEQVPAARGRAVAGKVSRAAGRVREAAEAGEEACQVIAKHAPRLGN
jgi:hypothetical protein